MVDNRRLCKPFELSDGRKIHQYWIENEQGEAVPFEGDILDWARMFETRSQVSREYVAGCLVSSIFLGVVVEFYDPRPPVYGLMVFRRGVSVAGEWRFRTRAETVQAHVMVARLLRSGVPPEKLDELLEAVP